MRMEVGLRRVASDRSLELRFWCSDCRFGFFIGVDDLHLMGGTEHRVPVRACYCVQDSPFGPGYRNDSELATQVYRAEARVRGPTLRDPPAAQPIRREMEREQPPAAPVEAPPAIDDRPDATIRFSLLELK